MKQEVREEAHLPNEGHIVYDRMCGFVLSVESPYAKYFMTMNNGEIRFSCYKRPNFIQRSLLKFLGIKYETR